MPGSQKLVLGRVWWVWAIILLAFGCLGLEIGGGVGFNGLG